MPQGGGGGGASSNVPANGFYLRRKNGVVGQVKRKLSADSEDDDRRKKRRVEEGRGNGSLIKVNGYKSHVDDEETGKRKVELSRHRSSSGSNGSSTKRVYAKEYVVEKILCHKVANKRHLFKIKWMGWDVKLSTWEPMQHLERSPQILKEFLCAYIKESYPKLLKILHTTDQRKVIESYVSRKGILSIPDQLESGRVLLDVLHPEAKSSSLDGKEALYGFVAIERRAEQLSLLKDWEERINSTTVEAAVIRIENDVDLEGPPADFRYINVRTFADGVEPLRKAARSCGCAACGGKSDGCCGVHRGDRHRYFQYKFGRMNMPPGCPIYECNAGCRCDARCANRVVQNGRRIPLAIFRTSTGCGWGVRALRKVTRGEFICEYVGEVITQDEAERRGRIYDATGRTYLFDLDYNSSDNPYTVDAAKFGNVSHFINHSCEPNIGVWAVWVDCPDPNLPRLALFALRSIGRDEELTFDYRSNNGDAKSPMRQKEPPESNGAGIPCKCRAKKCRKFLFC